MEWFALFFGINVSSQSGGYLSDPNSDCTWTLELTVSRSPLLHSTGGVLVKLKV